MKEIKMSSREEFFKRYEDEKVDLLLKLAREWEHDTDWDHINKKLRPKDIDFIREFKQHIDWNKVSENVRSDPNIRKEYGEEIRNWIEEEYHYKMEMLSAMIKNFV